MVVKQIDADLFKKMTQASAKILKQNAKFINSLNVFPVPDGDTGSNMTATLTNGAKYVANDSSTSVGTLFKDFAKGLLMGARGNSGVITSQIFRGFAKSVQNKKVLTAKDIINGLVNSTLVAYQSVMNPQEGTILTVIREATQAGLDAYHQSSNNNLVSLFDKISKSAEEALQTTPNLMAVLKKVGVVDSGGQGLVLVLKSWATIISGKKLQKLSKPTPEEMNQLIKIQHNKGAQSQLDPSKIKYGYCTQMTVRFGKGKEYDTPFDYHIFYNYLAQLGNSLLVANDKDVVKVHVHTEHPGRVLAWGQHFGDLTKVKVDNMRKQQEDMIKRDKAKAKKSHKADNMFTTDQAKQVKTAVVSISAGEGIHKLFKSLGVYAQVNGGQTMNPSTQDILNVIKQCGDKDVIILPNNGNVYMASKSAAEASKNNCSVIKTKSIQQGMAVMLNYNPQGNLKDNVSNMSDGLDECTPAAITLATRNEDSDGQKVIKDSYIGVSRHKIITTSTSANKDHQTGLKEITINTIKKLLNDASGVVTIIYSTPQLKSLAQNICKEIQTKYSSLDLETENYCGGQPVYPFLISIE